MKPYKILPDVHVTLPARNRKNIANDTAGCTVVEAGEMVFAKHKNAVAWQDIVCITLAGNLKATTQIKKSIFYAPHPHNSFDSCYI